MLRNVRSGAPQELRPLDPQESGIRIVWEPDDEMWPELARMLEGRPDARLAIERGEDLECLRWFPGLRRLDAVSLRLRSIEGLRHVAAGLQDLRLGDTLSRASLRPLEQLHDLRRLAIQGSWLDVDTVGRLLQLERLGIGTIDLRSLLPLRSLRRFTSGLGTVRSLELLPEVGRLELVELYRLRGAHDLTSLAGVSTLRYLLLESTRSITALPSLAGNRELGWVSLDGMRGITDLRPVADAPALEVLLLVSMGHLTVDDLSPLVGHPTLRAGIWGLGSDRKNAAAQALLPLPPSEADPPPWEHPDWTGPRHPSLT